MLVHDPKFKDNSLKDQRQGDLHCEACCASFPKDYIFRDRIIVHINGIRHKKKLKLWHESTKRQKMIGQLVGELNTGVDVSESDKTFRFEMTRGFMIGGLAFKGLDAVRPAIERHSGESLTSSSHLGECEFTHRPYYHGPSCIVTCNSK